MYRNPFGGIKALRVTKHDRHRWHFLKPGEYMALLTAAPDLRSKVFYSLAYTSGARAGELYNLTPANIDFDRGKLLIFGRAGTDAMPPFHTKSQEDREIPLPRHTLRLVAGWLKVRGNGSPYLLLTPERYRLVLEHWQACQNDNTPWLNDFMVNNALRGLRRHAAQAGIQPAGKLTLHALRKSCAMNWAAHLPMATVKEFMGHADISTTAEFYAQVCEEQEAKAAWIIEAITVGSCRASDARMTPAPEKGEKRKAG